VRREQQAELACRSMRLVNKRSSSMRTTAPAVVLPSTGSLKDPSRTGAARAAGSTASSTGARPLSFSSSCVAVWVQRLSAHDDQRAHVLVGDAAHDAAHAISTPPGSVPNSST
jgi:hypothetical protein